MNGNYSKKAVTYGGEGEDASDIARLKRRKSPDDISGDGDLRTAVCGVHEGARWKR